MVYDAARSNIVLYGGYASPPLGMGSGFVLESRSNLLEGTWLPVASNLPAHPAGIMNWMGETNGVGPLYLRVTLP